MEHYKLVVLTNPVEGREDDYNAWYEGRHLDDILKVPGFTQAQRFVVDNPLPGAPPTHKYLAIYDFESDDLAATMQIFLANGGTEKMPISDALAPDASPVVYRVIGPARKRDQE